LNSRRIRTQTAIAGLTALVGLTAATASATATPDQGVTASKKPRIPQTTCFWANRIASKFSDDPATNYAFPDSGAVYWTAKVTMPEGSRIVLKGKYAHARYQSLNSYNGTTNAPTDALNDISTRADSGSTNPFKPGASRDKPRRSYTMTVLNQTVPAVKAPNALYAGVDGQTVQQVIYRIYEPDSFTEEELTGAVGLPVPELRLADGSVQRGQKACDTLKAQNGPLAITTLPKATYESLREPAGKPATYPALPSPVFRTFYGTANVLSCWYGADCGGTPPRAGGQYSNIDNEYVGAFVNRAFPGGPVLVLKGKLPTTPQTGTDVKKMGTGQLRYWSICQNESLYTTIGAGCLYDTEVPVDKSGRYTIVTSKAADRPKNATRKCGVGYIPWPAAGDGAGHLDDGFLIVRNMLPASNFRQAIQNTRSPGDEAAVMGAYLPKGTYTTKAAFQKEGCSR
jgi:hypothetical protein